MALVPPVIKTPLLGQFKNIAFGFFTREGGISQSHSGFKSLNVALHNGDIQKDVTENRRIICNSLNLNLDHLALVVQKHSNIVHSINQAYKIPPVGDALVTSVPNLILGIQTADCVPVLLTDPNKKIIAAAHAGWRGAVKGILENTVQEMIKQGADLTNIYGALGPCIWQQSYEVKDNFINEMQRYPNAYEKRFFISTEKQNSYLFDLSGYVTHRLIKMGIQHIDPSPFNTFSHPERFFSYRYKTLNNSPFNGCQLSVICLKS